MEKSCKVCLFKDECYQSDSFKCDSPNESLRNYCKKLEIEIEELKCYIEGMKRGINHNLLEKKDLNERINIMKNCYNCNNHQDNCDIIQQGKCLSTVNLDYWTIMKCPF